MVSVGKVPGKTCTLPDHSHHGRSRCPLPQNRNRYARYPSNCRDSARTQERIWLRISIGFISASTVKTARFASDPEPF